MESTNKELTNEVADHNNKMVKRIYEMTSQSEHCDAVLVINEIRC